MLDEANEFVLVVDKVRSVTAIPTVDGASVVLTLEGPTEIAIVELTQPELAALIGGLSKLCTHEGES